MAPFPSSGATGGSGEDPLLPTLPSPPRKPTARARKLVFAYTGMQGGALYVGLLFAALGSVLGYVFAGGIPGELAIDLARGEAAGEVTSVAVDTSVRINRRNPTRVEFEYQVDGQRFQGQSSWLGPLKLENGAQAPVEYSRWAPRFARVAGTNYSVMGYAGAYTLVLPLLGFGLVFFAVRSNRREIRAYRYGVPVMARVTFFGEDQATGKQGSHPLKIAWEFEAGGRTWQGSLQAFDHADFSPYAGARHVVVLYDRARPDCSTLWVD